MRILGRQYPLYAVVKSIAKRQTSGIIFDLPSCIGGSLLRDQKVLHLIRGVNDG